MIQKQEILEILQIDLVLYSVHCGIIQHPALAAIQEQKPIIETQQVAGEFKLKNTELYSTNRNFAIKSINSTNTHTCTYVCVLCQKTTHF